MKRLTIDEVPAIPPEAERVEGLVDVGDQRWRVAVDDPDRILVYLRYSPKPWAPGALPWAELYCSQKRSG